MLRLIGVLAIVVVVVALVGYGPEIADAAWSLVWNEIRPY